MRVVVGDPGNQERGPRCVGHVVEVVGGQQQELFEIGPGVDHDEQLAGQGGQQRLGDLPPFTGVVAQGRRVAERQLTEAEARPAWSLVAVTPR